MANPSPLLYQEGSQYSVEPARSPAAYQPPDAYYDEGAVQGQDFHAGQLHGQDFYAGGAPQPDYLVGPGHGGEAMFEELQIAENPAPAYDPQMRGEEEPKLGRPWFTIAVIVICIVIFIAEIGYNGWKLAPSSQNPQFGPSVQTLSKMGAKDATKISSGQIYRLFTAMWLHAGIFHILFNLSAIWQIGAPLEQKFGALRVAILYILSGIYGNLASCIFIPTGLSVGASGSIFGLIGSLWADVIQNCNKETPGQGRYSLPALLFATVICLLFDYCLLLTTLLI